MTEQGQEASWPDGPSNSGNWRMPMPAHRVCPVWGSLKGPEQEQSIGNSVRKWTFDGTAVISSVSMPHGNQDNFPRDLLELPSASLVLVELRSAGRLVFHLEHSPPFTMSFIPDHPGHLMIRNSLAYLPLLLLEGCGYATSLEMQLCHLFKILLPWRLLMAVLPQLKCIWASKMLFHLQRFHLHIVFWIHTCCLQYWFPFCVPEILKLHKSISEDQGHQADRALSPLLTLQSDSFWY